MAKGSSNSKLDTTAPIDAVFGAYDLGKYRIPYLSCVLTVQQCNDYLTLVGDDPAFTLANGKIEELFQRDIDEERVVDMARQYLNPDAANRPAFFNSLTVALLVKDAVDSPAPSKHPSDSNGTTNEYGPIRVSWDTQGPDKLPSLGTFGCIYWNKLGVHAVAIDGQHRLAALKRLGANNNPRAKSLGVSILFLVLDPKFGVKAEEKRPVELMRQLFIDLNKHARSVSRARQLLLDDLDPMAIALRKTVGPELNYVPSNEVDDLPPGAKGEFSSCLPLELVDWHGEQRAKVDSGPHATSILALEWALAGLCASKQFARKVVTSSSLYAATSSAVDDEDESDEYTRARKLLAPWFESVPGLSEEVCAAETQLRPIRLSSPVLQKMGEVIHSQWGKPLTYILSRAGPYGRLARYRVSERLLTARFGTWYQAQQAHDTAVVGAAKTALREKLETITAALTGSDPGCVTRFRDAVKHIQTKIKSVSVKGSEPEANLLFSLTGQRSMVLALRWLHDVGASERGASAQKVAADFDWSEPKTNGDKATVFARALSMAIDHWDKVEGGIVFTKAARYPPLNRFPKSFWQGSILKREAPQTVDFTGIGAERGARMLYLMTAAWMCRQLKDPTHHPAILKWFDSGRADCLQPLGNSAVGVHLKKALVNTAGMEQFGSTGHDANKFPFAFLAKMKFSDDQDFTAKEHKELVKNRVSWIWKHADSGQ